MSQQLLNLQAIASGQAAWDATLQTNLDAIKGALRTLAMSIFVQGTVGGPSTIRIQLQDANGANLAEQVYLRVRLCNNGTLVNSTNATLAVTGGSALAETHTAGKDLTFLSSAAGLIEFTVTDATAETITIRPAPAVIQPAFANYNNSLQLAHA